jgi:hypothetical protein
LNILLLVFVVSELLFLYNGPKWFPSKGFCQPCNSLPQAVALHLPAACISEGKARHNSDRLLAFSGYEVTTVEMQRNIQG